MTYPQIHTPYYYYYYFFDIIYIEKGGHAV